MNKYCSSLFTYDRVCGVYFGEASTIAGNPLTGERSRNPFRKLFCNTYDLGFTIVSKRTGVEATFQISQVIKDAEGDIIEWLMVPTLQTLKQLPQLAGQTIMVAND